MRLVGVLRPRPREAGSHSTWGCLRPDLAAGRGRGRARRTLQTAASLPSHAGNDGAATAAELAVWAGGQLNTGLD